MSFSSNYVYIYIYNLVLSCSILPVAKGEQLKWFLYIEIPKLDIMLTYQNDNEEYRFLSFKTIIVFAFVESDEYVDHYSLGNKECQVCFPLWKLTKNFIIILYTLKN